MTGNGSVVFDMAAGTAFTLGGLTAADVRRGQRYHPAKHRQCGPLR